MCEKAGYALSSPFSLAAPILRRLAINRRRREPTPALLQGSKPKGTSVVMMRGWTNPAAAHQHVDIIGSRPAACFGLIDARLVHALDNEQSGAGRHGPTAGPRPDPRSNRG